MLTKSFTEKKSRVIYTNDVNLNLYIKAFVFEEFKKLGFLQFDILKLILNVFFCMLLAVQIILRFLITLINSEI